MRNAECGVRNVRVGRRDATDCSSQFRIPNSAFRIGRKTKPGADSSPGWRSGEVAVTLRPRPKSCHLLYGIDPRRFRPLPAYLDAYPPPNGCTPTNVSVPTFHSALPGNRHHRAAHASLEGAEGTRRAP